MGAFSGFCSESLDACFQKSGGKSVQKSVHKLVQKSGGASGHYGVQCGSNLNGLVVCLRRLNISLHVTSQAKDVKTSNKSENLQRFQRLEYLTWEINRSLKEVTLFSINSIMKLLELIFSLTHCEFNGGHYVLDCEFRMSR